MMRGGIGRRLGNPKNGLTTLIGSRVNWSRQQCSARPWLDEENYGQIQDESAIKKEKAAFEEMSRKYPFFGGQFPDEVCTREEKEQLYRIANTVPESAPGLVKRYAKYVAYTFQRTSGWEFEDKIRRMHEVVEEVSRGYK